MSKITVELDAEALDQAIVDQLLETRLTLLRDYNLGTTKVFSTDPKEDRKQIRKMVKSLERVIGWYSVPDAYQFDELEPYDD